MATKEEVPRQTTKVTTDPMSDFSTSVATKEEVPRQTTKVTDPMAPRQSIFSKTQFATTPTTEDTNLQVNRSSSSSSKRSSLNNPLIDLESEPILTRVKNSMPKNSTEFERYVPEVSVLCGNGQVLPAPPPGFSYIKIKNSDICDTDNNFTTQSTDKPVVVSDDNLQFKVFEGVGDQGEWYDQEVGAVDSYLKNVLPSRR
jgi:hypothetical protein